MSSRMVTLTSIQAIHDQGLATLKKRDQLFKPGINGRIDPLTIRPARRIEDKIGHPGAVSRVADSQPQPQKIRRTRCPNDIPQAIVAAVPTGTL